jgi:hypothetical protein
MSTATGDILDRLTSPSQKSIRSVGGTRLTTKALNQLEGTIGSLHESDIFKVCVKTLQKSQIQHLLPSGS